MTPDFIFQVRPSADFSAKLAGNARPAKARSGGALSGDAMLGEAW